MRYVLILLTVFLTACSNPPTEKKAPTISFETQRTLKLSVTHFHDHNRTQFYSTIGEMEAWDGKQSSGKLAFKAEEGAENQETPFRPLAGLLLVTQDAVKAYTTRNEEINELQRFIDLKQWNNALKAQEALIRTQTTK